MCSLSKDEEFYSDIIAYKNYYERMLVVGMIVSTLKMVNVYSAGKHQDSGGRCATGLTTRGYNSSGCLKFQLLVIADYDLTPCW